VHCVCFRVSATCLGSSALKALHKSPQVDYYHSMASPAHYLRTIHSSFASHSTSSWGSHGALFDLGGLVNQYPPGLGYGPQEVPFRSVSRRRPPHIAPLEMPTSPKQSTMHARPPFTKFDPFADENSIEMVHSVPSHSNQHLSLIKTPPSPPLLSNASRAPPSQPIRRQTARNAWPPSDDIHGNVGVAINAPPPSASRALNTRDARAKLVAGILLNRVHAVGKPMRRRYLAGEPREYVKSRLSSVVTADHA
jgi:hypothetical protein